MDKISAAKAARGILLANGEKIPLYYLTDNTKEIDNGYIVSWNYPLKNRYRINEIRNKFRDQPNILVKPNRIYFYFDNNDNVLSREELTRISCSNIELYKFMINAEEHEAIKARYLECIRCGNISKTRLNEGMSAFIKAAIIGGIDELRKNENFRNELCESVENKKSDSDRNIMMNKQAISTDIDLITTIDILYQDINFNRESGIINKSDILRFLAIYTDISKIKNRQSISDVARRKINFPISINEVIKIELEKRKISFQQLIELSLDKALCEYRNNGFIPKEIIIESANTNVKNKGTIDRRYFVSFGRNKCELFDEYITFICKQGYPVSIEDTMRGLLYNYLNIERNE